MFLNVNCALKLIISFPIHSKYLPSIVQMFITRDLVIAFVQIKSHNQVLVVHVIVILRAYFPTNQRSKTGIHFRFDRLK